MGRKTNSLNSHHGESKSYPAEKGLPKEVAKLFDGDQKKDYYGAQEKQRHKKRRRAYFKKKDNDAVNGLD